MWPLNTKSESAATKQYTVEVGTAKPGETAVRRHYLNKDKALVESNDPSNTTLWSNFLNGIKIAGR